MNSKIPDLRCETRFIHAIAAGVSLSLVVAACGAPSEPGTKPNLKVPSAPAAVAVAGDGRVTLSWEDVEDADSYVVYFGTGELDADTANRIGSATSPHVIHDLENDTAYSFAVAGRNEAGEGEWSEVVVATPKAVLLPPSAPSDVTATAADAQVTVSWSAVDGAEAYELYWSETSPIDRDTATRVAPVTSPHVVTELANDTTFYFAVIATNQAGESGLSAEVEATPKTAETAPQPPTNVVAVAGDGVVSVGWNLAESATSYDLLYTDAEELNETTATRLTDVASPRIVSGLTNGTTYLFAVIARNAVGDSALSEVASATPEALVLSPQAPENVVASAGDELVIVSWDPVATATSYDLLYTDEDELTKATARRLSDVESPVTVPNLTNKTTYRFAVVALNAVGASELSLVVSATPETALLPPQPPSNVAVSAGDRSVIVSWDPVATAKSYELLYTDAAELTEATATRLTDVASPFGIEWLTNGTTYRFAIVALNAAGASEPSAVIAATPIGPPPAKPDNIVLTAGDATLTVSFTGDPSADSHELFYGTQSPLSEANSTRVGNVESPHTITGLVNGTEYFVRVRSRNLAGVTELSNEESATPLPPPPAAPSNVTVEAGIQQLEVSWESDPLADSHTVFVGKTTPLVPQDAEHRFDDVTSPFVISDLEPRSTYSVVVVSSRVGVLSPLSVEREGTPLAPVPNAPSEVAVTFGDSELTVTWTDSAWADSHDLYFGTESPLSEANATRHEDVTSPFTITGLTNGTRYYVALVARNESGSSEFSDEVDGTPLIPPEAPKVLMITNITGSGRNVEFSWLKPGTAESYTLYYRAGEEPEIGHPDTIVATTAVPSHMVTGLEYDTTYYFVVSASNAAGEGPVSDPITVTPRDNRPVITGVFPLEGGPNGGFDVTLKGTNFDSEVAPTRVWFGAVEASSVTVDSDEQITVQAPPAVASGWVPIRVSTQAGETVREFGFVYSPYAGAARVEFDIRTQYPRTIAAVGDFNGDGALDFVTTAGNQVRLEVIFGDGAGGELDRLLIQQPGASVGEAVITGDFDGDGHLDLAGAHRDFVQVHYGNGKGEFTAGEPIPGNRARDLAAADLDGDGRLELIVAYEEDPAAIFAADAEREWSRVMTFPSTGGKQYGVVVGSFNGSEDNHLDVALYVHPDGTHTSRLDFFLRDDSRIVGDDLYGFREGPYLTLSKTFTPAFVVRDFDGDGLEDLAVATRDVFLLKQDMYGYFNAVEHDMDNVELRGIHVADMDQDGLVDLVVLDGTRGEAAILYGTAPGEFAPAVGLGVRGTVQGGAVGDFNGDGLVDILSLGGGGTTFAATWLLNDGVHRLGTQKEARRLDTMVNARALLRGNFLDNKETLALIGGAGANNSWIRLFNRTNGILHDPVSIKAGIQPSQADAADFFGSGTRQIVLNSDTTSQITIVNNPGNSATVTDFATPGVVTSLAAGRIDGDSYADLALAIPSAEEIRIGLSDHSGGFTFSSIEIKADHVALGDFDGDGALDLVYADGRDLGFIWNDQPGFTPDPLTTQHPRNIRRVRTADVDKDGLTDVLVLVDGVLPQRPSVLIVHRNNGDGTWTQSEYEVGLEARDCAVGDGNGDDVRDIFVINKGSGTVSFLQGDGAGGFHPQVAIDAGGSPAGIAIRDPLIRKQRATVFVAGEQARGYLTELPPR